MVMVRQFRDLLEEIKFKFPAKKFPVKKNELGFYDAYYTEHGHNLRCPNCGGANWAVKNYQHLECNTCYNNYCNVGVLGLREI